MNNNRVSIVGDYQIELDVAGVLQGQGVDPSRARPAISATARDVIELAEELIAPAALYTILPVSDFRHQRITLGDDAASVFEGPLAARALAGAEEIAAAVCTIGAALEERMDELFASNPVAAMALDGAGIAALRQVTEETVARIRAKADTRGWGSGMRASPGQEGWSIWQQRVLFDLVPADEIGIRLTNACLMIPRKSVSFVVGLGPDMRPDAVTCDFCSKRQRCPWRVR